MIPERRNELPAVAALLLLDLVAAACLGRLFNTATAVGPLLAAVVAGHALAFGCRLRNLSVNATVFTVVGSALVLMVWLGLPGETVFGLPTAHTFEEIGRSVTEARRQFGIAVAPTAPTPGFTMVCVFMLVVLSALADWGAFRIRASIEASIPAFTIFVFAGILGTAEYRGLAAVSFVAALAGWYVTHQTTVVARARPWFVGSAETGRRALSRLGVGIGTVAVAGALIGVLLPFTQDPPAVAWRNRGRDQSRTTISPLVDIRSRLVARSDVIAFTVETPLRAYWRLTSLDVFDGDIWSSHGNYKNVKSAKSLGTRQGVINTQRFTIGNLRSIWLPVAYRPATTPSVDGISFDSDADAFITDQPTSDALDYTVNSAVTSPTADSLRRARPTAVADSQITLPDTIDPRVVALAAEITAGKPTAYDKALAIQQYFRGGRFTYDLNVPIGHNGDAIVDFLFNRRRGYCEQFAGTFAVLGRLAGLPTRVAVGFTAGEHDPATNTYTVRELNAHAWPEVYLGSAGWVAFEPTPGRGIPGAQDYTGQAESQANTERPSTASTAVPTTIAPATGGEDPSGATTTITPTPTTAPPASTGGGGPWRVVVYALLVLLVGAALLAAVPLTIAARRRRRYAAAATPVEQVLVAWQDTDEALRFAGARVRRSDTPAERVAGAEAVLAEGSVAVLERLANTVDVAAYAPDDAVTVQDAAAARADAESVRRAAFTTRSLWQRARFTVDPRRVRQGRRR